jgi:LPXTG-motif cell wall-anchored protein
MNLIQTLAHAGHDHTWTLGGEAHHLLWIAAGIATFAVGLYFVLRKKRG